MPQRNTSLESQATLNNCAFSIYITITTTQEWKREIVRARDWLGLQNNNKERSNTRATKGKERIKKKNKFFLNIYIKERKREWNEYQKTTQRVNWEKPKYSGLTTRAGATCEYRACYSSVQRGGSRVDMGHNENNCRIHYAHLIRYYRVAMTERANDV